MARQDCSPGFTISSPNTQRSGIRFRVATRYSDLWGPRMLGPPQRSSPTSQTCWNRATAGEPGRCHDISRPARTRPCDRPTKPAGCPRVEPHLDIEPTLPRTDSIGQLDRIEIRVMVAECFSPNEALHAISTKKRPAVGRREGGFQHRRSLPDRSRSATSLHQQETPRSAPPGSSGGDLRRGDRPDA